MNQKQKKNRSSPAQQLKYIPNVKSGLPEPTPENSYQDKCFHCDGEKTILDINKKHRRCPTCWGKGTITYYKNIE
jgi:DnaJ-class molecular chaperone